MLRHLPRPRAALLLTLGALAFALGACGSNDEATTTAKAGTGRYTIDEVAQLAGFKANAGGATWTSPTGCRVTVIMTTHAEVLTYRTTPDEPVVTNPADDIGVKFDPTPGCRDALTANLARVK